MDEMTDFDVDQQRHGNFNSEPCVLARGLNISQSNTHTVTTASGNTTSLDSHYLPEAYDNAVMYGVTQYNGIPHQHNLDMGVAATTNLHYSGINPSSSTGVLPLPINHRAPDQLPASTTFSVSGVSYDNFGRSSSFVDDVRGPFKRKSAEAIRGNFQYFDASASSSVAPPNARFSDGVAMVDTASMSLPQFRGNSIPSHMELGPPGSLWGRSGEAVMVHEHNHMIRGNYLGQPFQPVVPPWFEHCTNQSIPMPYMRGKDAKALSIFCFAVPPILRTIIITLMFCKSIVYDDIHNVLSGFRLSDTPSLLYSPAPNVSGSPLENANMGLQRYHDSNLSGLRFLHHPASPHHHNYHHPTLPMQAARGHNINFQPPVTAASYRVPTNSSRNAVIPAQNGFEMGTRHFGVVPPAGLRYIRPHRGFMPDAAIGHRHIPPMGFLRVDDAVVLDEVGMVDHHRDMRLDIEDMSYEASKQTQLAYFTIELLALGERIGNVSTGLSEESVSTLMKTRIYVTSTAINPEEEATEDQETDSCIICQDKYKNREKIGILECGHEYHADCLKKWLHVKNVCPICKSEALTPGKKKDKENRNQ
ncbi:putative E3 ubiquitin-protein ligase ZFP1 [Senna tora]|uniref:RING-type E3 ubiquitin transferase n=1 Tax=Senna tora TaxID=362788 RepID=A0A834X1N3_9FABA|nr:putative E3 ubiquitin-protein ligase ZFP1 [Senna tora]